MMGRPSEDRPSENGIDWEPCLVHPEYEPRPPKVPACSGCERLYFQAERERINAVRVAEDWLRQKGKRRESEEEV